MGKIPRPIGSVLGSDQVNICETLDKKTMKRLTKYMLGMVAVLMLVSCESDLLKGGLEPKGHYRTISVE
jgi:hypothetical protein